MKIFSNSPFFPRWLWPAISMVAASHAFAAETPAKLSGTKTLVVNGTLTFPAPGARDVCPDTNLRLDFPSTPSLGVSGKLQIFDAATNAVVDTIDAGAQFATQKIGGFDGFNYHPVIIAGRQVTIFPRHGSLAYDHAYYVKIDAGFFRGGIDNYSAVSDPMVWRFSTRKTAPAVGIAKVTVAADGSGDFCTVQGALDFIPEGNVKPITVFVRNGTYPEIIAFTDKHSITLLGEDRKRTVITYANNANFNGSGGNPYASSPPNPSAESRTGHVYRRGVLLAHRVNDFTLANLTIRNTTLAGGSQAETIILNGTTSARAILKDLDLFSFQDTLQVNGQTFISHCRIEGDVDFMWGTGPSFFDGVTAVSLRSNAFYTQVRNPATNHGFIFQNCTFTGTAGVGNNLLSRIGTGRFPNSEVVLIDCQLDPSVGDVGWEFSGGREGNPKDPAQVHFWEFNSHAANGEPVDMSKRLRGSRRLTLPADSGLIGDYRDFAFVLGNRWNPKNAPIFR